MEKIQQTLNEEPPYKPILVFGPMPGAGVEGDVNDVMEFIEKTATNTLKENLKTYYAKEIQAAKDLGKEYLDKVKESIGLQSKNGGGATNLPEDTAPPPFNGKPEPAGIGGKIQQVYDALKRQEIDTEIKARAEGELQFRFNLKF